MDRCLDELGWRYNKPHIFRDTLERIVCTPGLRYRELVNSKRAA